MGKVKIKKFEIPLLIFITINNIYWGIKDGFGWLESIASILSSLALILCVMDNIITRKKVK